VKLPAINRVTLFLLVVLGLAALYGVAWLSKPVTIAAGSAPAAPRAIALNTSLRACAAPGTTGHGGAAGVAVLAAANASSGHVGSGQATVSRLSAAANSVPLVRLSTPGTLTTTPVTAAPTTQQGQSGQGASSQPSSTGGVLIQAAGAMAQGLDADQTTTADGATLSCGAPATDYWFSGPGQLYASTIELYLMNTDDQPSSVEVDISTDAGPLQTSSDTGITVPPHGMIVQSLAGLVRGSRALTLHVRTSIGRVVAAVRESTKTSDAGQWLPPVQAPARRLVIPGMPTASGSRELYLAAPGGSDATVKLSVVTPNGSYQPTGANAIAVPAGSATRLELPSLSGVTGAAVLTSNVPVTAAFTVPGGPSGSPGVLVSAALPLQQQGVLADAGPASSSGSASLVLSATGRAARVRVAMGTSGLTAGSGGGTQVVSIPAGHSVTVKLTAPAGAAKSAPFGVVVTPLAGSGPVYAGRTLDGSGSTLLGVLPLVSAPTMAGLPAAQDSLLAVMP
jgi:hypothetical protein